MPRPACSRMHVLICLRRTLAGSLACPTPTPPMVSRIQGLKGPHIKWYYMKVERDLVDWVAQGFHKYGNHTANATALRKNTQFEAPEAALHL